MHNRSRVKFSPVLEPVERRALMSTSGARMTAFHPLPAVSTQIGVGSPTGPFADINATNPKRLDIYVFSDKTATHPFRPLADISPKWVVVNGVTYHNVKIRKDKVDENGDHIPDAIITITPRSKLDLTPGTTSLTISGMMRGRTPFGHEAWSGTAPISVGGGGGGGGGGVEQPYQAYVAITLSNSYGGQFVNVYVTGFPNGKKDGPFRIVRGQPSNFQTASGTGTHKFVVMVAAGSSFTIGATGTLHYGLDPSNRPTYELVYAGSGNNFNLVPA